MWEFSLNFKSENFELAKYVYGELNSFSKTGNGVITSHEDNGIISILIASDEKNKEIMQNLLSNVIIEVICTKFKSNYFDESLSLPLQDKLGITAFKKALLNFDRETDKYIVRKNLILEGNLFLESFYRFRLKTLQNKWEELVNLSNENKEYLVSKESFIDLLKFLVDNLDIYEDEISVVKEEGGYRIYAQGQEDSGVLFNDENMLSSVIDLSPQKINLYFNEGSSAITLLEKIFEKRIYINKSSFVNIKKFRLNQLT